jgi:hypothetical protein
MDPKLAMNYRHFTRVTPHDTKVDHARAIPYGSYDEDTASLILAMIGLTLVVAMVVSMLFVFRVL